MVESLCQDLPLGCCGVLSPPPTLSSAITWYFLWKNKIRIVKLIVLFGKTSSSFVIGFASLEVNIFKICMLVGHTSCPSLLLDYESQVQYLFPRAGEVKLAKFEQSTHATHLKTHGYLKLLHF